MPPAAPQPPGTTQPPPTTSAFKVINISSADHQAVAAHPATLAHYWKPRTNGTAGVSPQSAVFPADLEFFGGVTIQHALNMNAYVDSTPSAFGDVKQFEQRLSRSNLIHMTDPYVGATGYNRYDFGGDFGVSYPAVTTLGDNDLLLIIHAVAAGTSGGGYGHIYNIFLPNGLNYCATGTLLPAGFCNASPTSPNPAFCAFHGAVTFSDIGKTLFTVEPFNDPDFCGIDNFTANPTAPTPNGLQRDSAYSALSHELFETITDPNPGSGWVNPNPFYPAEIGDLCAYVTGQFVNGFVSPNNTTLYGKAYRVQFEYSNHQHACNNVGP